MDTIKLLSYIAVMMLVTYAVRVLPLILFRREIKSPFIKSFLHYIPYTVLAAMTFPAILYSTGSVVTAAAGTIIGFSFALRGFGLLTVAVVSCVSVFAVQWIMTLI